MGNRAMDDFAEAVRKDEDVARGLIFALAGKQGVEIVEAFIAYANARGFDVTGDDVEHLRQETVDERALREEELDGTGGAGLTARIVGRPFDAAALRKAIGAAAVPIKASSSPFTI